MLDPRIYRTGFVAVALAAVVLAFSLRDQPGGLQSTLAPDAFNGQNAYNSMQTLARQYPDRRPGSAGDDALAGFVAQSLQGDHGFSVSTSSFAGATADGPRTLETVIAVRAGQSNGSIVVVAHRDALSAPATSELSGTATLIELGQVLAGETTRRTIVLVSTSGSAGAAGATRVARSISGPVDAVIALGDLAGARVREPVVSPWSGGPVLAPPLLRNTLATALGAQAGMQPGGISLAGQLAHLSLPISLTEQGPFGARGQPAVLVSLAGEREPAPDEPVGNADRITTLGRSVLAAVTALDSGPAVPGSSAYLLFDGKLVPAWAIRLLVLALMLPVMMATIDAIARARRRGHSIVRWTSWVLTGAVPFALALLAVLVSKLAGLIHVAPPSAVGPGAVALRGAGAVLLVVLACVIALSLYALRPLLIRVAAVRVKPTAATSAGGASAGGGGGGGAGAARRAKHPPIQGAAVAVLLVMCITGLAIWIANPFAAVLLIPALHLWMWVVDPDVRLHPAASAAIVLAGLVPPLLVIVYYGVALGLGPIDVLWNGLLLIAGGGVAWLVVLEWSILLGCVVSVIAIAWHASREAQPEELRVTVRGPLSYAGPGSLGGTESALRR